jgi:3-deoxy-D-manno-octulosonate 8-phosphate phosphatase (KDO 8-P phosphatase)
LNYFKVRYNYINNNYKWLILFDIDGVFTDGKFTYSKDGKYLKVFGSWDFEALNLLNRKVEFKFVTADERGFVISEKRLSDVGYQLEYLQSSKRVECINVLKNTYRVVFIADSFTDSEALIAADLSFVPKNGHAKAKKVATFVLGSRGGEGAVSEMVLKLQKLKVMK